MRDLKGEIGDSVTNIETIKQKGEKPIPEKGLPPKKNNQIVIVLIVMIIILFIIFLFFLGSNGDNDYFSSDTYSPYISPFHTVELEVAGSASEGVSLHYTLDDYSMDFDYIDLPWSRTISAAQNGEWYYVYAQNNGKYGWIEATIKIDGVLVETDTSYSNYGVVSVGKYV